MMTLLEEKIITQKIDLTAFGIENQSLFLRREDLIHPFVSGNKFRKLKYNLIAAQNKRHSALLTFGGAFSNHIAATAAAGKELGLRTIGVIRGEEVSEKIKDNPTLSFALDCGMQLYFISREDYREKGNLKFLNELKEVFGDFYLLPEGGTNHLAVKGCAEILEEADTKFDFICVPVGTGGTMAGIVKASDERQKIIGFSSLKGDFQTLEISKYTSRTNYEVTNSYCFGGYGKIDIELIRFINEFHHKTEIPLDPVYTGKMMYGILRRLKDGYFNENSCILAIHTGGLQGVAGMNTILKRKKLPLIE